MGGTLGWAVGVRLPAAAPAPGVLMVTVLTPFFFERFEVLMIPQLHVSALRATGLAKTVDKWITLVGRSGLWISRWIFGWGVVIAGNRGTVL